MLWNGEYPSEILSKEEQKEGLKATEKIRRYVEEK